MTSQLTDDSPYCHSICYLTAAATISVGLGVSLPHLGQTGSSALRSILVLGGSSGVGAAAIQLLRLALPSAIIFTTASVQHHAHLVSLGATECFERSAQENTSIINSKTSENAGVDAIFDAVAAAARKPACFTALNERGPKIYAQVFTGDEVTVPSGVRSAAVFGRQILQTEGGMGAMSGLASLVESGKYTLPQKVEIIGTGYDSIPKGLDRVKAGVSGTKLVVTL